jgi:hypothetical protein
MQWDFDQVSIGSHLSFRNRGCCQRGEARVAVVEPEVELLRVDELGRTLVRQHLAERRALQQLQEVQAVRVAASNHEPGVQR